MSEPFTVEVPEHGVTVRYEMPGVVSVTVPYGIHPETHQQIPLDDPAAVTVEPRPTPVKARAAKKVVTAESKDVEAKQRD